MAELNLSEKVPFKKSARKAFNHVKSVLVNFVSHIQEQNIIVSCKIIRTEPASRSSDVYMKACNNPGNVLVYWSKISIIDSAS